MKSIPALLIGVSLLYGSQAIGADDKSSTEKLPEIYLDSPSTVPLATIKEIMEARGGKDIGEIWHVSLIKGDIRITKSSNSRDYPPGGAVEFWYKDKDGRWNSRPTA